MAYFSLICNVRPTNLKMSIKTNMNLFKRFFSLKTKIKPKICIVGAGPAGFYTAQRLVKKLETTEIDIYEKLPVPFGLVRYGVAPDHPEVKNVINTFTKTAEHPHVKYFGNVNLGQDITLKQLREAYHVVVLTYGADQSKSLGIPGETMKNCIEARRIVGWYNGLPSDSNLEIDLSGDTVAIFGQGNVAIDVARILLTPVDSLKETDITQHALNHLSSSKVKRVYLIGRRGPLQAAFTIKELREMLKLNQCQTIWKQEDFIDVAEHVPNLARPKKRITELMLQSLAEKPKQNYSKEFCPLFHRSPIEIVGQKAVKSVTLGVNNLIGDDLLLKKAVLTDLRENLDCSLVVPCIGYKSIQVDSDIPFDHINGVVKNENSKVSQGLYVSGWLGTGPTGVILTTMSNAFEVAERILFDLQNESILEHDKGGNKQCEEILRKKNVQVVNWEGWKKIDKYEQEEGKKMGKPREKVVDIKAMLEIV